MDHENALLAMHLDLSFQRLLSGFESYVVTIPRTGFFSYLEQVCVVSFFSSIYNLRIKINSCNWLYPVDLLSVVPRKYVEAERNPSENCTVIEVSKIREIFCKSVSSYYAQYARFRSDFYCEVLSSIEILLAESPYSSYISFIESSPKPAIFLRRGDKLMSESLFPSDNVLLGSLEEYPDLYLLSDDSCYAEYLKGMRKASDVVVGIRNSTGYSHWNDLHDDSSFWETIIQWNVMVKVPILFSSAESNMACTAYAARYERKQKFVPSMAFFQRPSLML
jgi:hypothetical protein